MEPLPVLSSIIDGLFFNEPWESGEVSWSFFVHTSIINKWEKIMTKMFTNSDWEMYEHILQIGSKLFEMHLLIVFRATKDQLNFLHDSIKNSQISFPWEENPTLFIDAPYFNTMKKFIKDNNLEAFILKIEEKLVPSVYSGEPIKVVYFNQSVSAKLDIIHEFKFFWDRQYILRDITFFMAFGFPWQQSYFLQQIRLNDDFYSALPIILRHLATLKYASDLDIMDLLSLRLAISDVRHPSKSNHIKYEIDFMIKRQLVKFIKNNRLSIHKYLVSKNSKPLRLLILYLFYEFQNFFDTSDMDDVESKSITLDDTIKLNEEIDVLKKLKQRFNVRYRIDGEGFDKMSLPLFVGLIESENVYAIELDTNYRWLNDVSMFELNRIISAYKQVSIYLRGKNTYNFIESFVAELKTITIDNFRFILRIVKCNLNDYRIFDNLTVSEAVDMYEDEGTWLSMFEFILKEIRKSNANEFQFNSKLIFQIRQPGNRYNRIDLNKIKFIIDKQNSKLEIRDVDTNEIVDLYCKIWDIQQEEKPDYKFYE